MLIPDYIDNSTHTLATLLNQLLEDNNQHILDRVCQEWFTPE
jgi:hypothetical protein